jgi:CNT family concentrative nucleoside transporter
VFFLLDDAVNALQKATDAGTGFVFGYLGGGPAPFQVTNPASSFILAFRALPLVLVIGALASLVNLAQLPPGSLSPRAQLMLITALCGFANLGSVGIIIGGMGAMIPERRSEVASLGVRSLFSGTAATCMSAAVVGMLLTR